MENIFIALVVLVLLALLGGLTMWGILLWRKITARDAARFYPPDAKPGRPLRPMTPGYPQVGPPQDLESEKTGASRDSASKAAPGAYPTKAPSSASSPVALGRPGSEGSGADATTLSGANKANSASIPPPHDIPPFSPPQFQGPSYSKAPIEREPNRLLGGGWAARLAVVAALTLLMAIPLVLISNVVNERSNRMRATINSLTQEWGPSQILTGPLLAVPLTVMVPATERISVGINAWRDVQVEREATRWFVLTPKTLDTKGLLNPELRRRGIYSSPVYTAEVDFMGSFELPAPADIEALPSFTGRLKSIEWDKARIVVGLSGATSLRSVGRLSLGGAEFEFKPGAVELPDLPKGFSANVDLSGRTGSLNFNFNMSFGGSQAINVAPVADSNRIMMGSSWPHPSFIGSSLPAAREISEEGFTAEWLVPSLVRSYQSLRLLPIDDPEERENRGRARSSQTQYESFLVGVSLMEPVDGYHQTGRAVKYAIIFISLNFLIFLLWERSLGRGSIHPVQYAVIGLALALFYLVLLALFEHVGFGTAYLLASTLDVIMVGGYSLMVTRQKRGAALVSALLGMLHGVLYVILSLEDYALLAGTALLVVAMAAVMLSTRRLADQSGNGKPCDGPKAPGGAPKPPASAKTRLAPDSGPMAPEASGGGIIDSKALNPSAAGMENNGLKASIPVAAGMESNGSKAGIPVALIPGQKR